MRANGFDGVCGFGDAVSKVRKCAPMRKIAVFFVFCLLLFPAFAAKKVTVEQLQQAVTALHAKPDVEAARAIAEMELTERLNPADADRLAPVCRARRRGARWPRLLTRRLFLIHRRRRYRPGLRRMWRHSDRCWH